jgi:hypothetical protein
MSKVGAAARILEGGQNRYLQTGLRLQMRSSLVRTIAESFESGHLGEQSQSLDHLIDPSMLFAELVEAPTAARAL